MSQTSYTSNAASFGSESSTDNVLKRCHSDFEEQEVLKSKVAKKNVITPELVSALDRTNTSDRNAMHIISSVLLSIGEDPEGYNLSSSTIRNNRIKLRKDIAANVKNTFQNELCLVIHWDGKLFTSGSLKEERLPIIASGVHIEQLLSIPAVDKGTGVKEAHAIYAVLKEWNLIDSVKAFCFDTTAVNTGKFSSNNY